LPHVAVDAVMNRVGEATGTFYNNQMHSYYKNLYSNPVEAEIHYNVGGAVNSVVSTVIGTQAYKNGSAVNVVRKFTDGDFGGLNVVSRALTGIALNDSGRPKPINGLAARGSDILAHPTEIIAAAATFVGGEVLGSKGVLTSMGVGSVASPLSENILRVIGGKSITSIPEIFDSMVEGAGSSSAIAGIATGGIGGTLKAMPSILASSGTFQAVRSLFVADFEPALATAATGVGERVADSAMLKTAKDVLTNASVNTAIGGWHLGFFSMKSGIAGLPDKPVPAGIRSPLESRISLWHSSAMIDLMNTKP
jgi:hypothetical protein